jgi:RHS repeat-associated protein
MIRPSNRASIRNISDYSPFGVQLAERTISGGYRFGFQGQESDDEINGEGNYISYKYRGYDPRIGRFHMVDPLAKDYPHNSPYAFSENDVIACVELEGLEKFYAADGAFLNQVGSSTKVMVVNDKIIKLKGGIEAVQKNLGQINTAITNPKVQTKHKEAGKTHLSWYTENSKEVTSKGTYKMIFDGKIVKSKEMTGKDLNLAKNAEYGITGEAKIIEEYSDGFNATILSSPFTSGPYGNGPTPNKTYTAEDLFETTESGMLNNSKTDGWKVTMEDYNGRTGLRIHPDCNSIGTAGCIGLRTDDKNLKSFHDFFKNQLSGKGTMKIDFNIPNNPNYGNDGKANPNVGQ